MKYLSKQNAMILFLFLVFFSYAIFLLQGLPFYMYGLDDFHLIYQTLHVGFLDILSYIFLQPLQLGGSFLFLGIYQRSVHGLFLKISYLISGMDPSFYYIVRALFFAATAILVYLFTKKITNNEGVSLGAGFFYASMATIYDALRYIGAGDTFSHFFIIAGLYFFVVFYQDKKSYEGKRKYLYPFIIFILAVLAMKSRETGILVLFVIGLFLVLKYKELKKNAMWWCMVFLLSLYLLPGLLAYVRAVNNEDTVSVEITPQTILPNIKHLFFYNPYTKTGAGEQVPVIFSLKQYLTETPGSLLGSLGFFMGWYFIAMFCLYGYYRLQKWRKGEKAPESLSPESASLNFTNDYLIGTLLWFGGASLLMLLYVNPSDYQALRYVGEMIAPLVILVVSFCYLVTDYLRQKNRSLLSRYLLPTFLVILFLSATINAGITSIYRRGGIGSIHKGMEQSTVTIFEDLYNQSFDPTFFFAITEISGEGKYIPCIFSTNISLADLTITNAPFLSISRPITEQNINEALTVYGLLYLISYREPLLSDAYPTIQLVKEIHPCEEGYYCELKEVVKKQSILPRFMKEQLGQEPKYFVYKIVKDPSKISFEKPVTMLCAGEEGLPENVL